MNYVSFSPHYPPNYIPFWVNLHNMGVTVLGLADIAWEELPQPLHAALIEYYRVGSAFNYDELLRALGYFTHRYGKIDRLESHNEFWLESDARLRTDFNIPGLHVEDMPRVKRKSEMKKMFKQAGLPVPRGRVIHALDDALALAQETGYPLVAKPDIGVGASRTFKLHNARELDEFFQNKPQGDYIFEEFIKGDMVTFDGLTDQDGKLVFINSLKYSGGLLETLNQSLDFWYCTQREIPADLLDAGTRIVQAYHLRERFFHFEFFRDSSGQLIPLEVNMRPPGGLATELFNYTNDIDIYREYANVVVHNRFEVLAERPYYCAYVARRLSFQYRYSPAEILSAYPRQVVHMVPPGGESNLALGDYGFIVRTPDQDEMEAMLHTIIEKTRD